jgi:hypothetical protein
MTKGNGMKNYAKKRNKETVYPDAPINTSSNKRKSVDITKAENGYIVSQWVEGSMDKPGYDRKIVCKTSAEAQKKAASLLKM